MEVAGARPAYNAWRYPAVRAIECPRSVTLWPLEQVSSALNIVRVRGWHSFQRSGGGRFVPVQRSSSRTGRDQPLAAGCRAFASPNIRSKALIALLSNSTAFTAFY